MAVVKVTSFHFEGAEPSRIYGTIYLRAGVKMAVVKVTGSHFEGAEPAVYMAQSTFEQV